MIYYVCVCVLMIEHVVSNDCMEEVFLYVLLILGSL